MKKVLRFVLSRSFLFGVLIIMQVVLFFSLIHLFSQVGTFAYLILTIVSVLVIIAVLERANTNPAYKIMWLLLVVTLPVMGPVFYLLWGNRSYKPKKAVRFREIDRRAAAAVGNNAAAQKAVCEKFPQVRRSVEYLAANAAAPVYRDTVCEYYPFGQDFFASFLRELENARRSVFLEYFIIEEGEMWNRSLEILKRKAAEGLDVRVIFDGLGCIMTLPDGYEDTLRRAGIKCHVFCPLRFSWHISDYRLFNHRDHRKIAVIDNEVGFTGGLNFADEYINRKNRFGVWKDTGFLMRGPGVYGLTLTFLKMWDFVAGTETPYTAFAPMGRHIGDGFVQPYCDSPLDEESVAENAYFNVIQSARHYVYITTPYLILDNEMLRTLCLAAKDGVDVRIVTPGVPDKWYVYYVTQSFYPELLRAGVRIYEYTPGFLHAKMYVSDDTMAIVGSANMDYRSLYLHFENCCAFYGGHMVQDVKADILQTLGQCREVTLRDTQRVPLYKWIAQTFLRFFAPLM